jgi:hypothetical protein
VSSMGCDTRRTAELMERCGDGVGDQGDQGAEEVLRGLE